MKNYIVGAIALWATVMTAQAADLRVMMSIAGALSQSDAQGKLDDTVKFYFGDQKTPPVQQMLESAKTNKKANAFGKSDEEACNRVFLSAMIQMQEHARKIGADAVVNIVSNYKKNVFSSSTEFECHVGNIMAGVALKGDFVKVTK